MIKNAYSTVEKEIYLNLEMFKLRRAYLNQKISLDIYA